MKPLTKLYWQLYLRGGLGIAALLSISQFSFSTQGRKLALNIVILAIFWIIHRWIKTHRTMLDYRSKSTKSPNFVRKSGFDTATQVHYREVMHSQQHHLN